MIRQTGRYVLAGLAGLGVSLAVTALMHEGVGFSATAAFATALGAVFTFHFLANAFFVFNSGTGRNTFLRYAGAALAFRLVDFLLFAGLQGFVTPYYIAVALAILITNMAKFLGACPSIRNDSVAGSEAWCSLPVGMCPAEWRR